MNNKIIYLLSIVVIFLMFSVSFNYHYVVNTDNHKYIMYSLDSLIKANNSSGNNSVVIMPYKLIGISITPIAGGVVSLVDKYNFSYNYDGKELLMNIYLLNNSVKMYSIYQLSGKADFKQLNWNDRDGIYTYYIKFNADSLLVIVVSTNYGQFTIYINGRNTDTITISRETYEKYKELWDGAVQRVNEAEQIFGVKFDTNSPQGILEAWDESLDDSRALRQGFEGVAVQTLTFLFFMILIPSNAIIFLSIIGLFVALIYNLKVANVKLMKQFKGTATEKDIIFSSLMSDIRAKRYMAMQRKLKDVALELSIPKQVVKYLTRRYKTLVELYRDFVDSDIDDEDEFIQYIMKQINDALASKEHFNPNIEIPNAVLKFMRHILRTIPIEDKSSLANKINRFEAYFMNFNSNRKKSNVVRDMDEKIRDLLEKQGR